MNSQPLTLKLAVIDDDVKPGTILHRALMYNNNPNIQIELVVVANTFGEGSELVEKILSKEIDCDFVLCDQDIGAEEPATELARELSSNNVFIITWSNSPSESHKKAGHMFLSKADVSENFIPRVLEVVDQIIQLKELRYRNTDFGDIR